MDKLEKIFGMQKLLDDDIAARRNLDFTTEEWMQKEVLAMLSELSEVLDEVNFKWWKNKKPKKKKTKHKKLVHNLQDAKSISPHSSMDYN